MAKVEKSSCSETNGSSYSMVVHSAEEMRVLGSELCFTNLNAVSRGVPLNILLNGDVGAGKTTFSRGFVKEWRGDDDVDVTSPSYLIDVTYERGDIVDGKSDEKNTLHHMDLYRLKKEDDLGVLLGKNIFTRPGVRLVEWPERLDESGNYMGCEVPSGGVGGGKVEIDIRMKDGRGGEEGAEGGDGEVLIDFSDLDIDGDAERIVTITAKDREGLISFLGDLLQ